MVDLEKSREEAIKMLSKISKQDVTVPFRGQTKIYTIREIIGELMICSDIGDTFLISWDETIDLMNDILKEKHG